MANVDQGAASNNAEYFFGSTVGLEVHIGSPSPSGLNPLAPAYAPYVDYQLGPVVTAINKVVAGNIQISNPA